MSVAPQPPRELQFSPDDAPGDVCDRVADYARREALAIERRRFFAQVAIALGRAAPREGGVAAGAELARDLARHMREPWVRDGIDRGLELFTGCIDETGRRCVAALVAEYLGWREPPDAFFRRVGPIFARHDAADLVRLARVVSGYARTPKPSADELRVLAAVSARDPSVGALLTVVGFTGEHRAEHLRSATKIPSLGSERLLRALTRAALAIEVEPGPAPIPIVGRPLLWFPRGVDHELRRVHLLFATAIV